MTSPNERNGPERVEPEHTSESMANDRFMHGLLGFMHQDSKAEKEIRIERLLAELDQPEAPTHHRFQINLKKLIPLASAAMIMLIAFTLFVFTPQPNAYAIVNDAIQATQSSTALRYEIRESDDESGFLGTLDMHGTRSRIQIQTPHGHSFIMGTDDEGDWSIRRDGSVDRLEPRDDAPRWLNLGESTILIASLDDFLNQLKESYSVEIVADSPSKSIQLSASRLTTVREPGPDHIAVWIDQDSQLVERLELSWNPKHPPRDQPRNRPPPSHPENTQPPQHRRPPPPPPHHMNPDDPKAESWFPEFLGPMPHFDEGRDPPPPPLIIFQRVDPIEMSEQNFSPPDP